MCSEPISLQMQGEGVSLLDAPASQYIEIRWQSPCGAAAHSLCRHVVFLVGQETVD